MISITCLASDKLAVLKKEETKTVRELVHRYLITPFRAAVSCRPCRPLDSRWLRRKLAESHGVAGERVTRGADLESAIRRGVGKTMGGKPYIIDVEIARIGPGADSTWRENFSVAAQRTHV